jgi:hypothetical protein
MIILIDKRSWYLRYKQPKSSLNKQASKRPQCPVDPRKLLSNPTQPPNYSDLITTKRTTILQTIYLYNQYSAA